MGAPLGRIAEFINWSESICDKVNLGTEVDTSMKGHVEIRMGIHDPLCTCQLGLSVVLLTVHVLPDREQYFALCLAKRNASVGCPQSAAAK